MIDAAHLENLLTFLAVARLGRYTAAAEALKVNHSTVSRRIAALERALGDRVLTRSSGGWEATDLGREFITVAERIENDLQTLQRGGRSEGLRGTVRILAPDAYTTDFLVPLIRRVQREHPELQFEVVSATQPARQARSGLDIEIVVGEPRVNRAVARQLHRYALALYASSEYLAEYGRPETIADLAEHRINYYIDSALRVDDLDAPLQRIPSFRAGLQSTSVFAHVAATRVGLGLGLLPVFLAEHDQQLVPVLEDTFRHDLSYWAVVREESLGHAAVRHAMSMLVGDAAEHLRRNPLNEHSERASTTSRAD